VVCPGSEHDPGEEQQWEPEEEEELEDEAEESFEANDSVEEAEEVSEQPLGLSSTRGIETIGGRGRRCVRGGPRAVATFFGLLAATALAARKVVHSHQSWSPPAEAPVQRGLHAKPSSPHRDTSRRLLESPFLADIVAGQILAAGPHVLNDSDHDLVWSLANSGLMRLCHGLDARETGSACDLDGVALTQQQRGLIVDVLQNMGDHKVRDVGMRLASALGGFTGNASDPESVKSHILASLGPHIMEFSN